MRWTGARCGRVPGRASLEKAGAAGAQAGERRGGREGRDVAGASHSFEFDGTATWRDSDGKSACSPRDGLRTPVELGVGLDATNEGLK